MKNLDFKKLLVFIALIIVAGIIIFFVIKAINNNKPTEDEVKLVENLATKYVVNFTSGYTTSYNGIDYLFQSDKQTYDTLETSAKIKIAIKYATENNINTAVSSTVIKNLEKSGDYKNFSQYEIYNGESIRKSIKAIFGKDFEDTSSKNNPSFLYDYEYNTKYDVYLVKNSKAISITDPNQNVKYEILETNKKDDKLVTTLVIAYVYDNGEVKKYASDKNGENIIVENVDKIPAENYKDFDKFDITFSKTEDGNYVFESIEKVK